MHTAASESPDGLRYGDHVDLRGGRFYGPVSLGAPPPQPPPPDVLSALPAAPVGFTGRDPELAALLGGLRPPDGSAAPAPARPWAVTGLGGIGKTALVLRAAHTARDAGWFSGGVLFLDLAGYDDAAVSPASAVAALLYALGVGDAHLPSKEVNQHALYLSRLATLADEGRRVLLLLDNVREAGQLPPLLPGSDAHRVVFTSRESQPSLPVRELALGPLSPRDSTALVTEALDGDDRLEREADSVGELTALCEHLPLALQIAAALLRRHRSRGRVASLVEELRSGHRLTGTLHSPGVDQYGRPLALAPVFEASMSRLPDGRAGALCLLARIACADYDTETAAEATGLPVTETLDVLDDLACAHLVTRDEPGDEGRERWRLHGLVRSYACARDAAEPGPAAAAHAARARVRRYFARRAEECDRHMPFPVHDPSPDAVRRREAALAWFDAEHANLVAAVLWPEDDEPEARVRLALSLAGYLRWRRFFEDWIAVGRAARPLARRMGDEHAEAAVCNHLGSALSRGGVAEEAIEPLTRAAHLFQRVGDPRGEGMAWNNLGLAQRRSGDPATALTTHTRARGRFRDLGDRWNEGRAQHNMGRALSDVGRDDEAAEAFTLACELHRGHDRIYHGDSLSSLGWALHLGGRTEEAVTALQEALRIRREYDNWYATGLTGSNLALALEVAGRSAEAAEARAEADVACARAGTRAIVYGHHH
ncbi:tetratricopeptide repeat protein [Streptomyces collinus]|uniref:tetratricopeptide repeat protein n=1 Tax=Streptomyces collinus TaxID=42684 RepID=UPI0029434BD8|nr:tetratricopeptide repeat protein [Streptomyces collinus]